MFVHVHVGAYTMYIIIYQFTRGEEINIELVSITHYYYHINTLTD